MDHKAAEDEFSDFFRVFWEPACHYASRILGNEQDAEDVVDAVFLKLYCKHGAGASLPNREAWVLRCVCNLALDQLPRRKIPPVSPQTVELEDAVVLRLLLGEALRHLSKRQRQVVVSRYLDGLSEGEVAAAMNISPSTVGTHLQRALATLRQLLTELPSAWDIR